MQLTSLLTLFVLLCYPVDTYGIELLGEEESFESNKQSSFEEIDRRARQGRPISQILDVKPTYSMEFRSPNKKDIKFTSDRIYQGTVKELLSPQSDIKCDLKMGVYAHDESREVQFVITEGNEGGTYSVSARRVKDFVFMDLKTATVLNYEGVGNNLLTVVAQDPTTKATFDSTQVNVSIIDVNDNPPIFDRHFQHVTVDEDIPLHTSVAKVVASDADIGPNGWLYYSFTEKSSLFAIDPVSGVVTLTRSLIGRKRRSYQLFVTARDRSLHPSIPTSTKFNHNITIAVQPVNRFSPKIKVVSQLENVLQGKQIFRYAVIRISDQDNGRAGEINEVQITSGNETGNFGIRRSDEEQNDFIIDIVKPLDLGKGTDLKLVLTAFDKGNPPRNGTVMLPVVIKNAHNMKLAFLQSKYEAKISELAPPHSSVVRVLAGNGQSGKNCHFNYVLVGGDSDSFKINHDTGLITTMSHLDYETKQLYKFQVQSLDAGTPRQMASVEVSVEIEDANDHDPEFDELSYQFEFFEDQRPGAKLLTITATDHDSGDNGKIRYSLTNTENVPFAIDPETGDITTLTSLDRDTGLQEHITLKVRASDFGKPFRRETETYVHIRIKALNDHLPVFEYFKCNIQVAENAPVGTLLTTLTAIDIDIAVSNALLYAIESAGNTDDTFKIDPASGELKTAKSLIGGVKEFSLYITVTDSVQKSKYPVTLKIKVVAGEAAVGFSNHVRVQCSVFPEYFKAKEQIKQQGNLKPSVSSNDKAAPKPPNQHFPEFQVHNALVNVSEEVSIGSSLIKLTSTDKDQGFNGMVMYSIVSGNIGSAFNINMQTGELYVESPLDRETMSKYSLNISSSDCGSPRKTAFTIVTVIVEDSNDNSPIFDKNSYSVELLENVTSGQTVVLVNATDPDEGKNGEVTYKIVNDYGGKFRIDSTSGRISVASALDYEDSTKYIIEVQAFDNALLSQKMTSTLAIVNLIDINDNAPVIVPQNANVSIPEDIPLDSVVATVSAQDPDTGAGGELEFKLLNNVKKFKIDPDSGVIKLRRRVDYESKSVYNLTIKVSDKGVPQLKSYANVIVNILDVNENSIVPAFVGVTSPLMYKVVKVLENQPSGTFVIKLKAKDQDSWFIRFAIIDGTGIDKFEMQPQTGIIRTTQVIHRADTDHYWLTVQAKDCEIYPLHTNIHLLIQVMPTKVVAPYFKPAVYYPTVQENVSAGESVVSVTAHNPNSDGSRLVYSIVRGDDTSKFAIDKDTGLIITTVPLDREEKDYYELTVQVSTNTTPPQFANLTFQVTVTDANDNGPEFIRYGDDDGFIYVKEREASSSPVELFRVFAKDEDIGTNGDLTYSFTSLEGSNRNLTINPKSGVVYSEQAWTLDDFLDFEISVTDGGIPQRSAHLSGSLIFVEKNPPSSNPPQFEKEIYRVTIKEDFDVGKSVLWVSAADRDYDSLSYSFLSGNIGNKFHIDSDKIMLAGKLDHEEVSSYNLTVAASDDHHVATTTLIIVIEDINDNAPQPAMTEYQVHISEDAKPGTLLTKVEAVDPDDIEQKSGVAYAINGSVIPKSMSLFKIHSKTGEIKTIKTLDYEDMKEHILIIEAKDEEKNARTSLFSVVISVDDVNDHKPVFLKSDFEAEVNVNSSPGTSIIKAFAFDEDDGTNALLKFSIKGGNRNEAFYIDQNSGIIQVAKNLDPTFNKYTLQIHVSDSGSPVKTAEAQVEIFVAGIKRPAIFDRPLFQASITENVGPGYPIMNVVFNGSLTSYDLVPMDSACWKDFEVNRKSGLITNKKSFDAEEMSECKLTIGATGSEGHEGQTQVIVKIINENDNVPVFSKALYLGYVSEGLPEKSAVIGENGEPLVINATDADVDGSDLIYEIVGCSAFIIDPRGGALTTAEVFDFEMVSSYKFKVKVSDGGVPSFAAFVDIEVFIQDVNDIPPIFIAHIFSATVFIPTFPGAEVVKVSAVDGDSPALTNLSYSILTPHLEEKFSISPSLGIITVKNVSLVSEATYHMKVSVSDGNFTDETTVDVHCTPLPRSDLKFSLKIYSASVLEGISTEREIATVRAVGYSVSEFVTYSIVTPSDVFLISESTGVVSTLPGKEFDREAVDQYEVVVQARDGRKPLPRVAQSVVLVTIEDANDNVPKFIEETYFFVVQVSADVKSSVGRVKALDEDIGSNGKVSYFLKSGGDSRFEVEQTTGNIKVRQLLDDVAIHRVFTLEIEARDNGLQQLSARAVVQVKVVDKETPIFHQLSYSKVLPEDVKVGEEVGRIQARSPGGASILYSIVQGDPLNQFSIELKTGVLTVVDSLDYETLTSYQLTVRATDAKTFSFGEINVDITVTDVNDIPPLFNRSLYLAKVSEAMPIGTSVISVYAFDGDSGINKALTYQLDSKTSGFFTISQDNNEISVAKKLDYEAHVVHEFKVIATDSGSPPLTGEARVRVVVEDANDNPPKFEQDNYATSVSGGVGPGFFVTRVIATDPDQSDVGKLHYSFISGNGKEFFELDSKSGVLTISRKAGLERGKVYDLGVQVTDGKWTAKTSVRVVIGDTNDHSPVFDQETYTVDLQENYPEGMFITMVTATDEDSGKYARIRYSIDDVEASEKFSIDADTGMIYSRLTFDRENVSHAFTSVPIRATDGGGKFGFCTVEVRILDENDNQPKFELTSYEITIQQSKPVGSHILVTSASDADTGSNSLLTYVILGHQTPPVFEIETDTGAIKIAKQPQVKTYRFYVLVKDGGSPQLGSMVPVSVNVVTKDAKILQFNKPEYRVSIAEDAKVGTVVTIVRPSFPGSTRPLISFKIIPGNSPSSRGEKFSIDAIGQIKLEDPLDHETLKRYVLVIEAEAASVSQVARTVVIVSVEDINDNIPHFLANPYRVSVPENIENGSKVLRVFAEDLDDSINGQIFYEFEEDPKFFAIDPHTGWITTVKHLDREDFNSRILRVRGTDRGNVTLSGHTAVHVTVLDVNDSPPKFTEDIFEFVVREDAIVGQEIGTIEAVDEDLYSDIYFFIMSGDPQTKFVIEQKTGKVSVQSSLDRESVSSYKLNVSASDGLYTSFVTLNITVLDANDNPPVCTQSIFIEHVQEDVKPGFEVLVVEATDEDADDNGKLKYSVFGQGIGVFSAENGTGRLLTAALLDRETHDMFNFMVSAEDRGGQACFSNITIILDDINDNKPVFTQAEYRKSVYEDARLNTVLLQVKADDADVGRNRKISYSLLNTAGNTFSIDSESGIISLEKSLNREVQESYSLTVQARDRGDPSKSSTCSVVIQVLNINDVPPEFEETSYKANVSEDSLKGTQVTTMHAISREAGDEDITYTILQGPDSDMFQIDKVTGAVTLQGSLDYESKKSYLLTIQASDVGPPVLSATTSLKIIVTDANDHVPEFGQAFYRPKVDENSYIDKFVLQVFATDLDHGSNSDIRYSIVKGNEAGKFKIDPISGVISVAASCDYELKSEYTLTVRAQDEGKPPLSSETEVNVQINDVNDNPPEFSHTNFTVSIRENAPSGTTVIFLRPHDRDGHGNAGPFNFMRLEGDGSKFKLHRNGLITKVGPLDHRDGQHKFKFRVFDSGEPPRFTDKTVTIKVVESITHPPEVEPLTVYLKLYSSQFNGGVIGSVKGSDPDKDPLTYSIVEPGAVSPFTITPDGVISAISNVLSKIYRLNVSVTDGKYFTYADVEIDVSDITDNILEHSLTLRLADLGPGAFVERNLVKCRKYLGSLLRVPARKVHIWSLQSAESNLDVVFAIMKRHKGFFDSHHIAHKLNSSRGDFERTVGVKVAYIGVSQCRLMQCPENYSCQTVFKPQNKQIRIMSERTTYISYEHSRSHACMCDRDRGCVSGISGKCSSNPCPAGYECADVLQGFQCKCVDSSKCDLETPICQDTSCITGDKAMTFGGDSYIKYQLKESFNEPSRSISFALKTTEPQGTLVFAAGQYDYSILEIVNGRLQLRFDFGSGAGVVDLDWARVNDGTWHHVTVKRHGNHATLILDKGRHRAWNKSPGKMRILNLDENAIYFGAKVVRSDRRRDTSNLGQQVENGFKGCLQNINLNGEDLPMSGSTSHVTAQPFKAAPGCRLSGACRVNTCPRDSTCVETMTSKKCECLPGHSGPDCQPFVGCEANPCKNDGTCSNGQERGYRCACKEGYTGTQCHIFIGQCVSSPCKNGGTCFPSGKNDFTCSCPKGVRGLTCDQDTRPCASNPCAFNTNCTNMGNDYQCECAPGLSGKNCEKGYHCSRQPCKNSGTCQVLDGGRNVCACVPGYTGPDCAQDVDECASSPCQNGGICVNTLGSFTCNCSTSTHGGKLCEQVLANVEARRGWPLGQTEIIGIAIFLAVLLLIVVLVVFIFRWRARRKRDRSPQSGAAKTTVLKVSPPVVGSEVTSPEPPTPPPREIHGYNVDDLGMPPGYDAEDSWRRRERTRKEFGTMKTLTSLSDNNLPGYHWDYTDIPADLVPGSPLSKERSGSYGGAECVPIAPEVPQRPSSFRSSQGSLDVPEVPKRPRNYKVSESEDGYPDPVPHIPKKPMEYINPKGKSASRYSMDSRYSEFSDATDLDPDIFKGRFPRPPREPYPESLDQHPVGVGSYAPTLTTRGSELGSITDGMYSEDDLEQVYLGNRMEACDDSPENSYLHSENCSEDEDDEDEGRFACGAPDPEFHKALQREIKEMMDELEELKMESEL